MSTTSIIITAALATFGGCATTPVPPAVHHEQPTIALDDATLTVEQVLAIHALAEAHAGLGTLTLTNTADGVALAGVAGSPFAPIWREGDVVTSIGGGRVAGERAVTLFPILTSRAMGGDVMLVEVLRDGEALMIRRTWDGLAVGDARLAAISEARQALAVASDVDELDPEEVTGLLDAGITKVDDVTYEISRDLITRVLANPMSLAKGARIVASVKDGVPDGFKMYGIKPNSAYAKLGFSNGDTLHAINGLALDSLDKGLEIYTKLKDATSLQVEVTRRGKPLTLTFVIR